MKRQSFTTVLIIGLLMISPTLWASNAGNTQKKETPKDDILRLSMEDVREMALQHNATAKNARLDVKMAKKKVWETTATGLPHIDGKVSYTNNLQIATTLIPAQFVDPDAGEDEFVGVKFGTQHNATAEITLSQLVFSGSYIVALQASKTYMRLSEEGLAKSEIEIKALVTDTYYLILLAEESKRTLTANLENVKTTLYETNELFKAGFTEDTDVDQLKLTVNEMENAVKSMDRQILVTYNLLKYQMGIPLTRKVELTETLDSIMAEIDTQSLLNSPFQLTHHIDYRMAETQEKSMKLLWKAEVSSYLPTISAFASHSQMAMRDSFNFFKKSDDRWFPSTVVGLNIQIPIFSSGERAARVAQAKMDLRKAENTRKQVEDGLKLGLIQARSTFSDALDTSRSAEKSLALAKKIYDKMTEKYKKGTASSLDLTQAHTQYLTAESKNTSAVVELLKAKTALDKALGRL